MKKILCLQLITIILTWTLVPGFVVAASAVDIIDVEAIKTSIESSIQELDNAQTEAEVETLLADRLPPIKNSIQSCLDKSASQITRLNNELLSLGETGAGDTKSIIDLRDDINIELGRVKENSITCKTLESEYEELFKKASDKKGELTAERLLEYNFSLIDSLGEFPEKISSLIKRSSNSLNLASSQQSSSKNWFIGLLISGIGLGLGFLMQAYLKNWLGKRVGVGGNPPFEFNLFDSINIHLPWIIAGLIAWLSFRNLNINSTDWNFATRAAFIVLLIGITNFIYRWLCKENSPGDNLHDLNKDIPKALVKRLRFATIAFVIGFAIFGYQWFAQIPETDLRVPYQISSITMAISLISILLVGGEFTDLKGRYRFLRVILIIACFLAIIAVITGYINAANYLIFASLTTMIAGLVLWILLWCLEQSVEGIINGKTKTSYKLRASLGIRAEENSSELGWLRLLSGLGLWAVFGLFLLYVWDFTDRAIPQVKLLATDGFQLSENTRFIPKNILIGLIVFAIVLSISIWLKARLERQWLRNIGMDRGSRDAVVTLTGYVGTIIALIMGLTAAGVSFSGLALVAGALSVGIGFGLQNIVNNFISGLILLFERPIHAGDYISVGDVEGTVKRISIRSTEIETLQRTNVIVPNSELISDQVTNWVLHDAYGVIYVPVGVAYGIDTELVQQLLLEVTHAHPEIVARPNLQQPMVRFEKFGDSSLDFTIVALVKNINKRFDVISDINFAIDAKFREHNIEIPFPQRDLHIRSNTINEKTVIPEFFKERKGEIEEVEPDKNE